MVLCRRGLEWKTKDGKKRRSEARVTSLHSVLDAQLCVKYDPSSYYSNDDDNDYNDVVHTSTKNNNTQPPTATATATPTHPDRDRHDQSAESFIASEYIQHTSEAVQRAYRWAVQDYEDVYGAARGGEVAS